MVERCISLLLASNDVDALDSRTAEEIRLIKEVIYSSAYRESFTCILHPAVQLSDVRSLLLRHKPHLLHLSGHSRESEGWVLDDHGDRIATIKCSELVKLVTSANQDSNLRLVFFSMCYSEDCAAAISSAVPYAIGVKGEIPAESLILFTHDFYEALASGQSVQVAFSNACDTLRSKGMEGADLMVLRVGSGTNPALPFINSMGFYQKTVEEALRNHLEEISFRYSKTAVWGQPGLTLEESYIDLDCGSLTWGNIIESIQNGTPLDPLNEGSASRTDLLTATMDWLEEKNSQEFLVIEGSPGSGKSSFTIRLAVELGKRGYQPIRVRLRDLGMVSDPIAEIERTVLGVETKALEQAIEENRIKTVLILDGWDELTLVPNQSLNERVGTFLESIRATVLQRWRGRVPIVLTGRPTKAVTTSRNMTRDTRILTIYRLTPAQLRDYLVKLDSIYTLSDDLSPHVDIILRQYQSDWKLALPPPSSLPSGTVDVIGWPLLAHVAYRLVRDCEPGRQAALIKDGTMLLRCLSEYYCKHSRRPSDDPLGSEVRSRLEAHELRSLVQETAIAITVKGTECISHEELEREMMSWSSSVDVARNMKLAGSIDTDIFLINYLFKSSVQPLGCEFIHKSLREFAFAQAVVDRLKRLKETRGVGIEDSMGEMVSAADLAILSRHWLSKEIWDHVERQIGWEIYRESPEYEDPKAFQRAEPPLGIDVWCRIRDRLAAAWTTWAFLNNEMMPSNIGMRPIKSTSELKTLRAVPTVDTAGEDARLGAAFFRLCATLHSTLAGRIMESSGLMDHQRSPWEELTIAETGGHSQARLSRTPNQQLCFFFPGRGDEELEQSTLKLAIAKINAYSIQTNEEFPEKCDLTFLVSIGTALERLCFRYCNLSNSNFSESDLSGADLEGADLSGAWLCKANLSRTNLRNTDLCYASLKQSNLEGASLTEANIKFADFREAKGLTVEQVSKAKNWQMAKFNSDLLDKLQALE